MTFMASLLELMPDVCTLYSAGDRDGYGDITFGSTGTAINCRYIRAAKMVRTNAGEERVSGSHVWLSGAFGVRAEDKLVLSDGTAPQILTVERFSDEDGPTHEVVYLV